MGMVAILVKWPQTNITSILFYILITPVHEIWVQINSPSISEKKMFRYKSGRPKWVALDERSKVRLTFGAYVKTSVSLGLKFLASIMIST